MFPLSDNNNYEIQSIILFTLLLGNWDIHLCSISVCIRSLSFCLFLYSMGIHIQYDFSDLFICVCLSQITSTFLK